MNIRQVLLGGTIAVATVAAPPLIVGAMGFTSAGIAAGTIAAKMMSAAAVANGGGVAAGSTVAVLQSIGAAGLSAPANAALVTAGVVAGGILGAKEKNSLEKV